MKCECGSEQFLEFVDKYVCRICWNIINKDMSAKEKQVGGDHYLTTNIRPFEWSMQHEDAQGRLAVLRFNIKKYGFRDKNGLEDIEKLHHILELYIEREKQQEFKVRDGLVCL